MIKFYDTSSLLLKVDTLFEEKELFAISSITLNELENIKTSNSKSEDVKYAARKLLHTLDENSGDYDIEIFKEHMLKPINEADLSVTADAKILACAKAYADRRTEEVCFVTNDLALKTLAKLFFAHIEKVEEDEDDYVISYSDGRINEED